ncbi:MAG: UDP-2,3-diacylglucosamine diphosphatase LpxI [Vampirovibrionales bacterium]|nr:UDP-2,3-diacylglucosamine diphosphatase LpxI [Vampirovibrionales bacterium]
MTDVCQPSVGRLGLLAGSGELPARVAQNAMAYGWDVAAFTMDRDNAAALRALGVSSLDAISPGLLGQNLALFKQRGVSHIVFAGKVSKWLLFRNPRLDAVALNALRRLALRNDDRMMLGLIDIIEAEGLQVLPQTAFLKDLILPACRLSQRSLFDEEVRDAAYGFHLAKEMGRLDIGQTVVVSQGMTLAVEAIEGTDECLRRAGKWGGRKGGVAVKVAKPSQDQRFDVPTVGVRTLKMMRDAGLRALVTEADATLYLDPQEMAAFADRAGMTVISVTADDLGVAADAAAPGRALRERAVAER